jgi:DNA gyrase subunit B|tara:strand:- start:2330 stop:5875 length:3546 start_codon:yes stop_codon:yes gene_type:complete
MSGKYDATHIKVLEGLEGVRKRASMYIGSTSKDGLHHLIYEAVDNSVDEALAGHCTKINVTINKDGSATIEDDGRGIPVDIHPQYKIPAVEVALTKLHAGGKFDKKTYMISGGLHGVGISVVNALSKKLIIEIKRGGKIYKQEYSRGKAKTKLSVIGKCDKNNTGTKVIFFPDDEIFSTLKFDYKVLETRFREIAFLNAGLKINLNDEIKNKKEEFFASGGLIEFVKWVNKSKEVMHKPIYFKREMNSNIIEISIQYNSGYQENIFGFVNTINTVEGGTHVSGFKTALTRVINDYVRKKGIIKNGKGEGLSGDDVREGLTSIISIKLPDPQFEGQTKTKLGNSEVKGFVDSIVTSALSEFFEENPTIARKIISKAVDAAKARLAAKKAKDLVRRKNAFSLGGLPGKLSDCSSKKSDDTEIYIVEGESAGGSGRMARNRENQAVLPLKGKILNVEKSSPTRALSSEEITNLITAIGTGVGENFNLEKLRYGKIIIMSVDGEEATFIKFPSGKISFVKIGEFIDESIEKRINISEYQVLCFSLKTRKTQFKPIKAVIKHPIQDELYEIKTSYGRNVKVTSSHSVFVFENGKVKLKKGNKIKKGDKIIAPKSLPLYNYNPLSKIDVLSLLLGKKEKIYIRGESIEELIKTKIKLRYGKKHELTDKRVIISKELREKLIRKRKSKKLSQKFLCKKLGVKQPCVYYDWEKGKSKPSFENFNKYLNVLNINSNQVLSQVQIAKSRLDNIWENQYKNSGRNKVKDYIELSQVQKENLSNISENVKICPTHYKTHGIKRFIHINNSLIKLVGFWMAEGSCSLRNGVRLAIGNNNHVLVNELNSSFKDIFGLDAKLSVYKNRCSELKLVNRAASLFWHKLFNSSKFSSSTKKIPDLIFNINKEMQLEFLRMYFLGDGTISKNGISFTTTSKDMANQLIYLFLSHNIIAGMNVKEPRSNGKIVSKNLAYTITITSRKDLIYLKKVWKDHRNAYYLNKKLNSKFKSINRKFELISEDLIALDVRAIEEVKSTNRQVYDFSVKEDENFIAGFGGLCCHNTDADVDGEHIKTLLLTFFFRFMPHLIENGNIYSAMPPLFRIRKKKDYYVYSDEELKKTVEKLGATNVTRFKGLGEMSATQLWDTTMSPKTRKLKKIFIEDAVEADRIFSMLMGDDVQSRKQFIQENAKEAQLDV